MIKLRINLTNIPLLTGGNLRGIPPGAGFVKRSAVPLRRIGHVIVKAKEQSYIFKIEKDTELEKEIQGALVRRLKGND